MALEDDLQRMTIKSLHSSSSSSSTESSESFPTEIVFEILSRLPVESLLRCKSVCKSWRSLISDPHFIKHHLTLSTTNHHYTHHHILVSSSVLGDNLKCCSLYDVMYDDHNPINPLELDYPMKNYCDWVTVEGSCNGLICLTVELDSVFIWNPSTRKSIQLPDSPNSDAEFVSYGFGYNESSDDYKVVEITCSSDVERDDSVVMIYSSKNGNWKEIGSFPHSIYSNQCGVFFKGALHWFALKNLHSLTIVSLDLAKDAYNEVMLPVDFDELGLDYFLGIVGDCLCVLCPHTRNGIYCVDIWVNKVYGVKDSWSKSISIRSDLEVGSAQFNSTSGFLAPLCFSNNGKVLIQLYSRLIVFDTKNDQALQIEKFNQCDQACTFVESLVSPAGHENLI